MTDAQLNSKNMTSTTHVHLRVIKYLLHVILHPMLKKYLLDLSKNVTASPSENPEEFCRQIKRASNKVPMDIAKSLIEFSHHGSETGFLLFDGFSYDDVAKTPDDNNQKIGEKTILAKIQSILVSTIGELVAYEAEGHGRIFQDIIPMKSMEKRQMSLSSGTELEIHNIKVFSCDIQNFIAIILYFVYILMYL